MTVLQLSLPTDAGGEGVELQSMYRLQALSALVLPTAPPPDFVFDVVVGPSAFGGDGAGAFGDAANAALWAPCGGTLPETLCTTAHDEVPAELGPSLAAAAAALGLAVPWGCWLLAWLGSALATCGEDLSEGNWRTYWKMSSQSTPFFLRFLISAISRAMVSDEYPSLTHMWATRCSSIR